MTVAVAAETMISHSVARVSTAPAAAPRSLSCQVRDCGLLDVNIITCFSPLIAGRESVDSLIALVPGGSYKTSLMTCCTCQIVETSKTYVTCGVDPDSDCMHIGRGKDLYLTTHESPMPTR